MNADKEIPYGYCHCGCGLKTPLYQRTNRNKGQRRGEPANFVLGHRLHSRGANHSRWQGGRIIDKDGYVLIFTPNHPRATKTGYVREHVLLAEKALGKFLPEGSIVHHANGTTNSGQLIICQDAAYHALIHQRMRAYKACGHANWLKCKVCKQYDDPSNMLPRGNGGRHKACHTLYEKNRRLSKRMVKNGTTALL